MLNKNKERELAYVVIVDAIEPIPGKDRVECARVNNWTCMVPRGAFKVGDPGVYFEIDSRLPDEEPFMFLERVKFKIKTQRYKTPDGPFFSQGLLMPASDFGWEIKGTTIIDNQGVVHEPNEESSFLTKQLKVTYYDPEDNKRKGNGPDKYKKMAARHPKLFQKRFIKWLYKKEWGKKLLFIFFGKKKDNRNWPAWVVKTDEERIENLPSYFQNKQEWIATEKIDGSSTTFTIKRGKYPWSKNDFYVCSRNVCFDTPEKAERCYYDSNIYLEMAEKYNMQSVMEQLLKDYPEAEFITIQAETFGAGVQKRDYTMTDHDMRVFNLIMSHTGRWNSSKGAEVLSKYGLKWVPILDEHFILPDTLDELRVYVDSEGSKIDGNMREGVVFRAQDGGLSFKCVSPNFLIKFHNG